MFVREEFLEPPLCDALCTQMRIVGDRPAEVFGEARTQVDRVVRRTSDAQIGGAAVDKVQQRVSALAPSLASYINADLDGCDDLSFLVYRAGDFYRPHRDRAAREGDFVDVARRRRVSVVLFLNHGYEGGALTIYGLVDDPKWREVGFAIAPAPGLLIAFPSHLIHEVTTVTAGDRFTAVTWFHA